MSTCIPKSPTALSNSYWPIQLPTHLISRYVLNHVCMKGKMWLENALVGYNPESASHRIFAFYKCNLSIAVVYLRAIFSTSVLFVIFDLMLGTCLAKVFRTAGNEAWKLNGSILNSLTCKGFKNIMKAFKVLNISIDGSSTSWLAFVSFVTVSCIQVLLFGRGSPTSCYPELSSTVTVNELFAAARLTGVFRLVQHGYEIGESLWPDYREDWK